MSGQSLAAVYCIGAAVLALWALVRFPDQAPSTLKGAMLALVAAVAAIAVVPSLLEYLVAHAGKPGGLLGLVGLVLPAVGALFWSAGSLFRLFAGHFGGGVR